MPDELDHRQQRAGGGAAVLHRDLRRRRARQPRPVRRGQLQSDLGARVPHSHHQDSALLELGRVPVACGVQLDDARIELPGERWDLRRVACAQRDHHGVRLEHMMTRGEHEPVVHSRQPIDRHTRAHREREPLAVRLEVVPDLVLRGERPPARREPEPW